MSLLVCGSSFDVDLPLSCDDEYLEHPDPEKAFKQPAGVPSQMDYFISMIRLIQILDFALRTLVRSPNPDLVVRVPKLIQRVVVVLDEEVANGPGLCGQTVGKPHPFFSGDRNGEVGRLGSAAPYDHPELCLRFS